MSKTDRLKKSREDAGYRSATAAASALGVSASTYRAHENGQNDFGFDDASVYAKKFKVDPIWLFTGKGSEPQTQNEEPNAFVGYEIKGKATTVKVYGQAVGGIDGEFEMNGNVLDTILAPPQISEISGAYAVLVSGDSMSPRYEDGETAFIDPRRRVRKGDYVIAQIRKEEHGAPLAYIKRFERHNASELVLSQFNPPKELVFPASQVVSVHYIALAGLA